ncbi:MAG: 2-oxo acid dehydrogenase subunit E2 [Chloroflexi bacterium]|nr:2-oxo acid dehydrogenase subunit E2 [Chloroflexota bacterium]
MIDSPFRELPFPRYRLGLTELLRAGHRPYTIHGLIEVDMTDALKTIHAYEQRTGDDLSMVAFIAYCLSRAIDADKQVQAFRTRGRLIVYDDVDVNIMIEREKHGRKIVAQHVLRKAHQRGVLEMSQEIREIQRTPVEEEPGLKLMNSYARLPSLFRALIMRATFRNHRLLKKRGGTTVITSVGMFGEGAGWGIPVSTMPLGLTLGGMEKKPAAVEDRIELRNMLCVTISLDHMITDGAPAARFTTRLKHLIETCSGLEFCKQEAAVHSEG